MHISHSQPHRLPTRRAAAPALSAFTLLELLIAMTIASIMVGVVFYIFGTMQRGTRASLLRAQISLTALTVEARLRDDFSYMLGPSRDPAVAAGCLVIIPALREGYVMLPNGQRSNNKVRLRSDQLMFIAQRSTTSPHPWVSLIPQDQNVPASAANTSYEARIWYGALQDGNTTGGPEALNAWQWLVGRELKLIQKTATGTEPVGPGGIDLSLQNAIDRTPAMPPASAGSLGGLASVQAAATWWDSAALRYTRAGWSDADYVNNLAGTGIPDSKTNYGNQPVTTPVVDLKQLQSGGNAANNPNGIQLTDLAQAHMRLLENCSEIVVQFAADLDKDGRIDTYPPGHPLAGSIIWYPEELHASTKKDATTKTRVTGALLTKYNAIAAHPWASQSFPAGFAPALGAWPAGRFGAMPASGQWVDRFQFDYGESDNAPGQAIAAPNVPSPYVFRFDDDQYRLVRYGFRQDGSAYANKFDGMAGIAPFPTPATTQRHWTPYPAMPGVATLMPNNPAPSQLYAPGNFKPPATPAAPAGPYPLASATPKAADGTNFGDQLGDVPLPLPSVAAPYAAGQYRAAPDTTYPNGQLLTITQAGAVAYTGANSPAAAEPVYDPASDTPYAKVPGDFGPANNHTAVYSDLYREYFKNINDPAKAGTVEDWRNPQSDWPKLVRIRLRLNDAQSLVFSYSDEALLNGRDDDGDGVVDNPEEGRMSGVWYEYILAVPYPLDSAPHGH